MQSNAFRSQFLPGHDGKDTKHPRSVSWDDRSLGVPDSEVETPDDALFLAMGEKLFDLEDKLKECIAMFEAQLDGPEGDESPHVVVAPGPAKRSSLKPVSSEWEGYSCVPGVPGTRNPCNVYTKLPPSEASVGVPWVPPHGYPNLPPKIAKVRKQANADLPPEERERKKIERLAKSKITREKNKAAKQAAIQHPPGWLPVPGHPDLPYQGPGAGLTSGQQTAPLPIVPNAVVLAASS